MSKAKGNLSWSTEPEAEVQFVGKSTFCLGGFYCGEFRIWDCVSGEEVYRLETPGNDNRYLDISPDGRYVASHDRIGKMINIYRLPMMEHLERLAELAHSRVRRAEPDFDRKIPLSHERKIHQINIARGKNDSITRAEVLAADPAIQALVDQSDEWEWSEPQLLPEPLNTEHEENGLFLSEDGLTLLFHSDRLHMDDSDIWISTRESQDKFFGPPQPVMGRVNTLGNDEEAPFLSWDGRRLYFHSDRPGGHGQEDIWMATRTEPNDPFETPVNLGPNVNSSLGDRRPVLSRDELSIVLNSSRESAEGFSSLFLSRRNSLSDPFPEGKLLSLVNSPGREIPHMVSLDGRALLYTSSRGFGDRYHFAFWMAYRSDPNGEFQEPIPLAEPISSLKFDGSIQLNSDQNVIYLTSNRTGGLGANDIWVSHLVRKAFNDDNGR